MIPVPGWVRVWLASTVTAVVVAADEEAAIARATVEVLKRGLRHRGGPGGGQT